MKATVEGAKLMIGEIEKQSKTITELASENKRLKASLQRIDDLAKFSDRIAVLVQIREVIRTSIDGATPPPPHSPAATKPR